LQKPAKMVSPIQVRLLKFALLLLLMASSCFSTTSGQYCFKHCIDLDSDGNFAASSTLSEPMDVAEKPQSDEEFRFPSGGDRKDGKRSLTNEMKQMFKLSNELNNLESKVNSVSKELRKLMTSVAGTSQPLTRSCQGITPPVNGVYEIKPSDELPSFTASCSFNNGRAITTVHHDSEDEIEVAPKCEKRGCYRKELMYNATYEQIRSLIDHSGNCRQFIKYRSIGSVLLRQSYGGWMSYDGTWRRYWGGSHGKEGYCQCGIRGTCVERRHKCNCDANVDDRMLVDDGYLEDENHLPVRALKFGDTREKKEHGWHTVGALQCIT